MDENARMSTLISRQTAVAVIGATSIMAIGCGLTKALLQPEENKTKGTCIFGASVVALIITANLLKGTTALSALISSFSRA